MRIPRIFTNQPLQLHTVSELEESPSRHIGKVLRMQAGREVVLFNGDGNEYHGTLTDVGKKRVQVEILQMLTADRESPLNTELAIGVSRGERMDWVIQKATELGINRIVPLFTERTEVKLSGERLQKKQQHWQQIAISACEQCQRNHVPEIAQATTLGQWLTDAQSQLRLVLHHRNANSLNDFSQQHPTLTSASFLIGPEGGLSETEIEQALAQHCQALTLGPRVLRTETAPIVALSLSQYLWGDLG